jgi:hypothetical protein
MKNPASEAARREAEEDWGRQLAIESTESPEDRRQ